MNIVAAKQMSELEHAAVLPAKSSDALHLTRHTVLVRMTHWVHTLSFFASVISGIAILLAHPRLYWGENGAFGSPAMLELPLPLNMDQSGWGRSLHFLAAWVCVLNGTVYVLSGLVSGHFRTNMLPARAEFAWQPILYRISRVMRWSKPGGEETLRYNVLQQLTYLIVIFVLFPLIILTGLAMSPAVTAAVPVIVAVFGGYQSSRTVHFFVTNLLILFLMLHIVMVCLTGFRNRMRAMTTGRVDIIKENV